MTPGGTAAWIGPTLLLQELRRLRDVVASEGRLQFQQWRPSITRHRFLPSALNLAHYLALRRRELRPLQDALAPWGLSTLGRSESRVLPTLEAVVGTLEAALGERRPIDEHDSRQRRFARRASLLDFACGEAFGPRTGLRRVRILVTLSETYGEAPEILDRLLAAGMDCARINCAHGTRDQWLSTAAALRAASARHGKACRLLVDLGGPKLRTEEVLAAGGQRLEVGAHLLLTRLPPEPLAGFPLQARCSLPQALDQAAEGDHVWIDDGRTGCIVESRHPSGLLLRVLSTRPSGDELRPCKGLNFPDTELHLSPLTPKDREDLDFVAEHADLVGYSFVQEMADIELLQAELRARQPKGAAKTIVVKVETRKAVRNLPELIVAAAGKQPLAVMIARGDLAVEIGYERLAEIQEEILWLCEAAHVPVIWATQVLERLVKKGTPTRGEITDAAMGERAECVMLNKGPHVVAAVTILDDVLRRMEAHQTKKTARLRALHSW